MPKQLFLDPSSSWELPPETDLEELRSRLRQALEGGSGVVEVAVVVEGQEAALLLHPAAVAAVLVADLPGSGQRRIAH